MKSKVCVLIEDDADDRALFATAMKELFTEVEVVTFDNARDAIHGIRDKGINPSMVFLDLNMPCVNGYQVLVYLKGQMRYSRIPVVVYSTSDDPAEITRTRKLGAFAFLEKPANYTELKQKLSDLLLNADIFRPQIAL